MQRAPSGALGAAIDDGQFARPGDGEFDADGASRSAGADDHHMLSSRIGQSFQ